MNDEVIPFKATTPEPSEGKSGTDAIPFKPKTEVGGVDAVTRGLESGFYFGYAPQVAALAEASGLVPEIKLPDGSTLPSRSAVPTIVGAGRIGLEKLAPSVFGEKGSKRYEERLASEKALQAAAREQYPNVSMAAEIGGSLLNPITKIIPAPKGGETFVSNFARAAPASAAIGAVQGSSEGETWAEKGMNALKGLIGGGVTGGVVGGILGKAMPAAGPSVSGPTAKEIVEASERVSSAGSKLEVPKIIASESDSLLSLSGLAKDVPFVGAPLRKAAEKTGQQLETKLEELSGGSTRESAGTVAKEALEDWIGSRSRKLVSDAYDEVDRYITTPAIRPLDATRKTAQAIQNNLNKEMKVLGDDPAVAKLMNAITDPNGLSYKGTKELRTLVGDMLDNPQDIYKGASGSLKKLYGALTEDLKEIVKKSGGPKAFAEFEKANNFNKQISDQRNALLRITGKQTTSRSGDEIFDTLLKQAGSSGATDIPKLALAKSVMKPEEWEAVSKAMINRLSTNRTTNNFDPASFFRQYNKLSEKGKDILFGEVTAGSYATRHALDDLSKIGTRLDRLSAITPQQGSGEKKLLTAAELLAVVFHPVKAASGLMAGRAFSSAMAEPATAQSVANWAKAYEILGSKPSSATAQAFVRASQNLATEVGGRYGLPDTDTVLNAIIGGVELAKLASMVHGKLTDMSPPREEGHRVPQDTVFDTGRAEGGRTGRASGGAVNLMALSKAAKKQVTQVTEPLLNESDDTVAHALEIANKQI
jgi:hypothetical protein